MKTFECFFVERTSVNHVIAALKYRSKQSKKLITCSTTKQPLLKPATFTPLNNSLVNIINTTTQCKQSANTNATHCRESPNINTQQCIKNGTDANSIQSEKDLNFNTIQCKESLNVSTTQCRDSFNDTVDESHTITAVLHYKRINMDLVK